MCLCVQSRQKTVYLQHRTSTHPTVASDVCFSVQKLSRGGGRLGRVAEDVKITASISSLSLSCESVIHCLCCYC